MTGRRPPERQRFNDKRKIRQVCDPKELAQLARRVRYTGNPEHKSDPGDFNLNPPIAPRPYKTLCNEAGINRVKTALSLLREGVRRGMISEQSRGEFPQNIWCVTDDGFPLEAQLENQAQGIYHGYPVPRTDPMRNEILERWNQL